MDQWSTLFAVVAPIITAIVGGIVALRIASGRNRMETIRADRDQLIRFYERELEHARSEAVRREVEAERWRRLALAGIETAEELEQVVADLSRPGGLES